MTRSARRLGILFIAVLLPTAATLIWLGLRLLAQDRALSAQSEVKRHEQAAETAALRLRGQLEATLDRRLPHTVRFHLEPRSIVPDDGRLVLWLPVDPAGTADPPPEFADWEMREYRGQTAEALAAYLELAHSTSEATASWALQGAARIFRARRDWEGAIAAYRRLAAFRRVRLNAMPADLLARRAECDVLEAAGRTRELAIAAESLERDFSAGAWTLDAGAWELVRRDIERWTGRALSIHQDSRMFTAAAAIVWRSWSDGGWRTLRGVRTRMITVADATLTVVERQDERGAVASVLSPEGVRAALMASASGRSVSLLDGDRLIAGPPVPANRVVVRRLPIATNLPWTIAVSAGIDSAEIRELAGRRRLLLGGLAAIVFLLAGGGFLIWRVVQRELAVARLQTEFVAAVSHEFRTPLASLRHVTELLEEDDDLPEGARRTFYEALGRNTERLHRLVESLLDFARMESGRKPYELRHVDAGALAERVATEFGREVAPQGYRVTLELQQARDLVVEAEEESLARALWNLLDNAVKYSPERRDVTLSVCAHPAGVAFAVTDRGLGIPASERSEIFGRFVRGARARELGIRGTGLGLAMVQHIVEAHRGRVELESQEGAGSTFRVVLPAAA